MKGTKDKKTKQTKLKTADQGGALAEKSKSNTDPNRSNDNVTDNLPDFEKKLWTKIIKIGENTSSSIQLNLLQSDFDEMRNDPLMRPKSSRMPWELLFDPDLLEQQHDELLMDDFKLS